MKGTSTSPLIIKNDDKSSHKTEEDEEDDGFLKFRKGIQNHNTATVGCMTFYSHRRHSRKSGSSGKKEQKSKEAIAGRKHKENQDSENLFDKSFKRFYHSKTHSEDVAQMLAPIWAPPLEMMAVGWLGDWRPSAILELLRSLACSSYLSPSSADSAETDRIIAQLIHEIRIEETIIDEEMSEIQANCILHLPFRPTNRATTSFNDTEDHDCVQFELKKIKQVVSKAQQLRYKVLELVSNKVLNEADAGKFLVVFSGIQDKIHQFAANQKLQKGPVSVSVKALATFE